MRKIKNMLKKPEFHVFFFAVCFVLLCLPFLIFRNTSDTVNMFSLNMFLYFFCVWLAIIIVLAFIARSLRNDESCPPSNDHDGSRDV